MCCALGRFHVRRVAGRFGLRAGGRKEGVRNNETAVLGPDDGDLKELDNVNLTCWGKSAICLDFRLTINYYFNKMIINGIVV